ncbi:MAG: phospholipid carrier-dependent glycosyltransferase [Anaerolineales bacterium]|nr:phospholipid carrier-dependent glycosyltransferase [Anaerolineales bacterium]
MKSKIQAMWPIILGLLLITIALWLPRGLELNRFVTPDESKWLTRSANFYVALAKGDFADTYQKEHPGVTVMWAETAGFLWRFPGYVTERPGQLDRPQKFKRFLEHRGYDDVPMLLLEAGRTFIVLGNVIVLTLAFLAAIKLIGLLPSLVGFLLIAFDPFSLGLSRLLHPDALLSAMMLLSLLSYMNFLYRGRHFYYLTIAAVAAGLAWLTKSPSFFLIPFFGLLSLVEIGRSWWEKRQLSLRDTWKNIWPILAWAGIAALVFVLMWPAMWVDPLGSLQKVFGEAVTYAAEGHYTTTFFNGQIFEAGISNWRFYPVNYLWRTTPPILIGLVLAGIVIIFRRRLSFPKELQGATLILILFALLYTIFMTIGDKKFDRYLLPVFAPLVLVAAVGWVTIIQNALIWMTSFWITGPKAEKVTQVGTATLFTSVVLIQLIGPLQTFPYYLSYYNPIMGGSSKAAEVMMIGWGEGLDQAARYLNAKPDAVKLKVQSWYPDGSFSYIFDGKTINRDFAANPEEIQRADYYVIYYHQWQRQLPSPEFIDYFDQQVPEHIVYINGLEYARIYRRE